MEDKITFEEMYEAYNLCLRNKKRKLGTYKFVNDNLCENLMMLVDKLNNRNYIPQSSNCYVITEPALREIYAAEFGDRVIQHFYMKKIEDILEGELIDGCCSCRKGKGTQYALNLLKKYLVETSNYGKSDCFYLKIDLSGYFMSIDRKQVAEKSSKLIETQYKGKHKELLLYLTPIIFENNPALNCRYKCNERMRARVPERRTMKKDSAYGMAIGNLTAQAGSNLNLSEFDKYVVNKLNLKNYVRYVDDIVIVSNDKRKLIESIPLIEKELAETHQIVNRKKTRVDTAYYGISFLGKISYPYGYQKPSKKVIVRVCKKAEKINYNDEQDNLLAKVNSQIGSLKNYNCKKLILHYVRMLPKEINEILKFDDSKYRFSRI